MQNAVPIICFCRMSVLTGIIIAQLWLVWEFTTERLVAMREHREHKEIQSKLDRPSERRQRQKKEKEATNLESDEGQQEQEDEPAAPAAAAAATASAPAKSESQPRKRKGKH